MTGVQTIRVSVRKLTILLIWTKTSGGLVTPSENMLLHHSKRLQFMCLELQSEWSFAPGCHSWRTVFVVVAEKWARDCDEAVDKSLLRNLTAQPSRGSSKDGVALTVPQYDSSYSLPPFAPLSE